MTRKQAALKAIELLSGDEENKEVCEALGKIVNGRLTEIWNKELVLETIQDFISENGYYPSIKEMDIDPMLPAHTLAYLAIGMGYLKTKEIYFPDAVVKQVYKSKIQEEWMEKFKNLYREIGMPSQRLFNIQREAGEGCASTWVRRTGCASWNDCCRRAVLGRT